VRQSGQIFPLQNMRASSVAMWLKFRFGLNYFYGVFTPHF
jgi:hypothetical protein